MQSINQLSDEDKGMALLAFRRLREQGVREVRLAEDMPHGVLVMELAETFFLAGFAERAIQETIVEG